MHNLLRVGDQATDVLPEKKAYGVCAMPSRYVWIDIPRLSRQPSRESWITQCDVMRGGQQWVWSIWATVKTCGVGGMESGGS